MTRGYLHHELRYTHDNIRAPQLMAHHRGPYTDDGSPPLSPPPSPLMNEPSIPDFPAPPPLGYGCQICSAVLAEPKATQKDSEVIHPSVFYSYTDVAKNVFRHISFHAITTRTGGGEEIENPFKDRRFGRNRERRELLKSAEIIEYLTKEDIQVSVLRL